MTYQLKANLRFQKYHESCSPRAMEQLSFGILTIACLEVELLAKMAFGDIQTIPLASKLSGELEPKH